MDEITVHLFLGEDDRYHYRIYDCAPEDVIGEQPVDRGVCEMSMSTALGIAIDITKSYLRRLRK